MEWCKSYNCTCPVSLSLPLPPARRWCDSGSGIWDGGKDQNCNSQGSGSPAVCTPLIAVPTMPYKHPRSWSPPWCLLFPLQKQLKHIWSVVPQLCFLAWKRFAVPLHRRFQPSSSPCLQPRYLQRNRVVLVSEESPATSIRVCSQSDTKLSLRLI